MKSDFLDFHLFSLTDWRQMENRLSGGNRRGVLLVIDQQDDQKELTDFLGKILSAVQIDMEEDALLLKITKGENISFSHFARAHTVHHALLFGVPPRQLGLHFAPPPQHPIAFGGRYFLYTSALQALFEEREAPSRPLAAALWKNLKKLFPDSRTPQ